MPASAHSAEWPSRITFVVPFGPGSTTDIETRVIAEHLAKKIGSQVVVENRAGGDGAVAAEYVSRAKPDGSILLMLTNGMIGIPAIQGDQPWKPRAFTPIAGVGRSPQILVVGNHVPASSITELITYAARSGPLAYGSGGVSGKVAALLFGKYSKTATNIIPYKGDPAAVNDLLGGHIHAIFALGAASIGQVQSGKVRALAVVNPSRVQQLPNVPTITEAGLSRLEDIISVMPHRSVVGPPGMTAALAEQFSREIGEIIRDPQVVEKFRTLVTEPTPRNPREVGAYVADQERRWARIVRENNLAEKK